MEPQASLANLIEQWCREATGLWGNDWPKISAHIASQYAALPDHQRQALEAEADITVANSMTNTAGTLRDALNSLQ